MEYKDYYATLGLDKKANADDIKKAYRRLARKYHPDVSKEANAEEQFKSVQEAYEVLKNPEKRAAYDQLGSQWQAGQDFRPPPHWEGARGNRQHQEPPFGAEDRGGFSDFFSNLFNRDGQRHQQAQYGDFKQRGADQQAVITLTLEEAFKGSTKTFQLEMPEYSADGQVKTHAKTIKLTIPPGTLPGQQLRLAGQGGPGFNGGAAGDLFLTTEILPHTLYHLEGSDIYLTLPLSPWEAALGTQVALPTLAGKVDLKVPAGASAGQKLRLKGRGMPVKPSAGDQYAVVQIVVPPITTPEQKALWEDLARKIPFNPRQQWQ